MLRRTRAGTPADLLVVGLGNPGARYARTRHNLGASAVEVLAERGRAALRVTRGVRSLTAEVRVGDQRLALAFPQTWMNDSGAAVSALVRRYGISDLSRLVVVHDELDLPVGRVKVKLGGGAAGHNGLASVRSHLRDGGFVRVRVGIGKPPASMSGADYVLRPPPRSERESLDGAVAQAADAATTIMTEGLDKAMNRYNATT